MFIKMYFMISAKMRKEGAENTVDEHEKDLERIAGFCLMDDEFMAKCFEDNIQCIELILRIILKKNGLQVQRVQTQKFIKNLQGRSIRADIIATDEEQKKYNIEVQRANAGASPKRARYNSSVIDANITEPDEDYEKLPESYVIFITEKDVSKKGLPVYHIDRTFKESGEDFGDASHIIYVNGEYQDDSPLGKLMHDFHCTDPNEMYYETLKKRVSYFKKEEEGINYMCEMLDEMRQEAERRGEMRGENKLLRLIQALIADSRQDVIAAVAFDVDKRAEYYRIYNME